MREVTFVLTDHGGHGVGITSAQIPGLIAGERAMEDVTPTSLLNLMREAGVDADGFVVFVERLVEHDGQVFAVRCRQDFAISERAQIADSLVHTLALSNEARTGWPVTSLGDVVLAAALPTDIVGDIAASVPEGEPVFAVASHEGAVIAVGIQSPGAEDSRLTVDDLISRSVGADTPHRARAVALSG